MENVRAHVKIEGQVQGVCFRMETLRAAKARKLTGWVKNLPDGRVEAVFEGDRAAVNAMLSWCDTGPPMARVTRVATEWEPYSGQLSSFKVTY